MTKVATGVYKYVGSTTSNAAPNTTLSSISNTSASGTTAGVHRGYAELKSGSEGSGTATYHIYNATYCTGINATSSNTKTTPYILTVNAYNKVTTNCTATTVLDYGRVIEGSGSNTKFVNYYRNPIDCNYSAVYSITSSNSTRSFSFTAYSSIDSSTYESKLLYYQLRNYCQGDGNSWPHYYVYYYAKVTFKVNKYNSITSKEITYSSKQVKYDDKIALTNQSFSTYTDKSEWRTSTH